MFFYCIVCHIGLDPEFEEKKEQKDDEFDEMKDEEKGGDATINKSDLITTGFEKDRKGRSKSNIAGSEPTKTAQKTHKIGEKFEQSEWSITQSSKFQPNPQLSVAREQLKTVRHRIRPFLKEIQKEDEFTSFAEQGAELIERCRKVGLDCKAWRSYKGSNIFLLVGLPHINLMQWADARNVDILINSEKAIRYGCEDFMNFTLAKSTATEEEQAEVDKRLEDEQKQGIWIRFSKSIERIGKSAQRRYTVFSDAVTGAGNDGEDEFEGPRQKISREIWNNIFCQYITKTDIQFIYKEIFDEHTRLRLFYDLLIAGMFVFYFV